MIMIKYTITYNRYSYCLNNPLKYTDPTGQRYVDDIWDFDREGNFLKRTENKNFDQIRVLNDDGSVFAETDKRPFGTFENIMNLYKQSVLIAREKHDLEGLSMNFGENIKGAMEAFKFLAKNTNPEWHAVGTTDWSGKRENLLATTHNPGFEYFGTQFAKQAAYNGYLIYDVHSHKTTPFPSDRISMKGRNGDIEIKLDLLQKSPNAVFGILYNGVISDYRTNRIGFDNNGYPIYGY